MKRLASKELGQLAAASSQGTACQQVREGAQPAVPAEACDDCGPDRQPDYRFMSGLAENGQLSRVRTLCDNKCLPSTPQSF